MKLPEHHCKSCGKAFVSGFGGLVRRDICDECESERRKDDVTGPNWWLLVLLALMSLLAIGLTVLVSA